MVLLLFPVSRNYISRNYSLQFQRFRVTLKSFQRYSRNKNHSLHKINHFGQFMSERQKRNSLSFKDIGKIQKKRAQGTKEEGKKHKRGGLPAAIAGAAFPVNHYGYKNKNSTDVGSRY